VERERLEALSGRRRRQEPRGGTSQNRNGDQSERDGDVEEGILNRGGGAGRRWWMVGPRRKGAWKDFKERVILGRDVEVSYVDVKELVVLKGVAGPGGSPTDVGRGGVIGGVDVETVTETPPTGITATPCSSNEVEVVESEPEFIVSTAPLPSTTTTTGGQQGGPMMMSLRNRDHVWDVPGVESLGTPTTVTTVSTAEAQQQQQQQPFVQDVVVASTSPAGTTVSAGPIIIISNNSNYSSVNPDDIMESSYESLQSHPSNSSTSAISAATAMTHPTTKATTSTARSQDEPSSPLSSIPPTPTTTTIPNSSKRNFKIPKNLFRRKHSTAAKNTATTPSTESLLSSFISTSHHNHNQNRSHGGDNNNNEDQDEMHMIEVESSVEVYTEPPPRFSFALREREEAERGQRERERGLN
jgi:hypothetical protein